MNSKLMQQLEKGETEVKQKSKALEALAEEIPDKARWFDMEPEIDPSHWVPSHESNPWWSRHSRDTMEGLISTTCPSIQFGAWQSLGTEASFTETKNAQS